MAYVDPNYKTKKAFREAVERGVQHETYNPSGMFPVKQNGRDVVEGPHGYHKWWAQVVVKDGIVISVK